jgi:hypothetical protein
VFTPGEIRNLVRRRPFVPIRIVTSSGESYDVRHPDLIMVGQQWLVVGRASATDPATFDLVNHVAILHVTAIQDLPAPAPASNP